MHKEGVTALLLANSLLLICNTRSWQRLLKLALRLPEVMNGTVAVASINVFSAEHLLLTLITTAVTGAVRE
jgi:hypothetical protein